MSLGTARHLGHGRRDCSRWSDGPIRTRQPEDADRDFDQPSVETGFWRWWWRERASSQNPVLGPMVPYVLDLMENVDRLAATEGVVVRSGDLAIIRLRGL
jgi:hypothetical protein